MLLTKRDDSILTMLEATYTFDKCTNLLRKSGLTLDIENYIMEMGFTGSYRSYHGIVDTNLQEKLEGNPDNMANMASQPDLALVTLAGPIRK